MKRSATFATLMVLTGLASGCSQVMTADPFLMTSSVTPRGEAIASEVAPEFAAASLPSLAGAIQSVRQSVGRDHLRQEVVYANQTTMAGENILRIEVGQPGDGTYLRPPSEASLRRDIRAAFPSTNIAMSPLIRDNGQGAYGYAVASIGNGGACLYAWQFIKSVNSQDAEGYLTLSRTRLAAHVRLRYCSPALNADQIVAVMDGMRVRTINAATLEMLRFAAGSAHVETPPLVVSAAPVTVVTKRPAVAKVAVEEDWRKDADRAVVEKKAAPVIENPVAVPLPGHDIVASRETGVTKTAYDPADADPEMLRKKAIAVPLPQ